MTAGDVTYDVKRGVNNGALSLSVTPSVNPSDLPMSQLRAIAASAVEKHKGFERMVRVYFEEQVQPPAVAKRVCSFQWTRAGGLTLLACTFIDPQKDPQVKAMYKLPEYSVLEYVVQGIGLTEGRISGDILIPSFSRRTPVSERERVAILIAKSEGFHDIHVYATREAQEANLNADYAKKHPSAKEGLLFVILEGKAMYE